MKKLLFATLFVLLGFTPALSWQLVWDPNPVAEAVTGYGVYENGVLVSEVATPGFDLGAALPEACWTVDAFNQYGLRSDMSEQVCVGRPSAPTSGGLPNPTIVQ